MDKLAGTGLLGLLLTMSLGTVYYLFKKLNDEKDARIADGKETMKVVMDVQKSVSDIVNKLTDVIEWAQKRTEEIARTDRRGGTR
jgi:peptidoglycan hydrolase CwlO-like protein